MQYDYSSAGENKLLCSLSVSCSSHLAPKTLPPHSWISKSPPSLINTRCVWATPSHIIIFCLSVSSSLLILSVRKINVGSCQKPVCMRCYKKDSADMKSVLLACDCLLCIPLCSCELVDLLRPHVVTQ